MWKTYILLMSVIIILVAGTVLLRGNKNESEFSACTMEAKLCPDGSAVGRTGPQCEFAPCPEIVVVPPVATTGDVVLGVGQKGSVGDLSIAVNSFVSDSRCPVDVQCIWAGEFKVNVTLASGAGSETRNMSSAEAPYSFGGYRVSIASAFPAPKSTTKITEDEYRITFHVATDVKKDSGNVSTLRGLVTLSPICPVERMPPDPQCAPKPYQTKIEAFSSESGKLIKSTQTGIDGHFTLMLPFGNYRIQAGTGTIHPSCPPITLSLKTVTTSIDISCDTGIR